MKINLPKQVTANTYLRDEIRFAQVNSVKTSQGKICKRGTQKILRKRIHCKATLNFYSSVARSVLCRHLDKSSDTKTFKHLMSHGVLLYSVRLVQELRQVIMIPKPSRG